MNHWVQPYRSITIYRGRSSCFQFRHFSACLTTTIATTTTTTAIIIHPMFRPQTRSQPCSIDAGGNIFQRVGGTNVRNQEGAHTNKADRNRPPLAGGSANKWANHLSTTVVVRRRKYRESETPNTGTSGSGADSRIDPAGGQRGDSRLDTADRHWGDSKLDSAGGRYQGANVLRHAGGILRCRSVYASSRTPGRSSSSSVTGIADTAAVAAAPAKPMLRAYSAPQFLHSTSFPPMSPTHSTCGSMSASVAGVDSSHGGRFQALTTGADDARRRYQTSATGAADDGRTSRNHQTSATRADDGRTSRKYQAPVASSGSRGRREQTSNGDTRRQGDNSTPTIAVAAAAVGGAGVAEAGPGVGTGATEAGAAGAPCRHRRAGYLHRYMGFVQNRVASPPLESFRALGGLREYPRKESRTVIVVGATIGHDGSASTNPATGEATTSEHGGGGVRRSLGTRSELSYGRRLSAAAAVGSPSGTAITPKQACPLELFADGSSLVPTSPPNATPTIPAWCSRSRNRPKGAKRQESWEADGRRGAHPKDALKNKPPGSSSLKRSKAAKTGRNRRAGSPYLAGVPLPYDLERPVSPERAIAFRYTCN